MKISNKTLLNFSEEKFGLDEQATREQFIQAFKELLRLRTLVPLAARMVSECSEKMFCSRTLLHLELEIEKYRKDFQIE